jgi:hypothetical protein
MPDLFQAQGEFPEANGWDAEDGLVALWLSLKSARYSDLDWMAGGQKRLPGENKLKSEV